MRPASAFSPRPAGIRVPLHALALVVGLSAAPRSASAGPFASHDRGESGLLGLYLLLDDLGYQVTRASFEQAAVPADLILSAEPDAEALSAIAQRVRRGAVALVALTSLSGCTDLAPGPRRAPSEGTLVFFDDGQLSQSYAGCAFVADDLTPGDRVLVGLADEAVVIERRYGEGTLLLFADHTLLENAALPTGEIANTLRRWLERNVPTRASIVFLEHQEPGLLARLTRARLLPLAGHALLAVLIVYWLLTLAGHRPLRKLASHDRAHHVHGLAALLPSDAETTETRARWR